VYRSRLSASGKELLLEVTWSQVPNGPTLSVADHEAAAAALCHCASSGAAAPTRKEEGEGGAAAVGVTPPAVVVLGRGGSWEVGSGDTRMVGRWFRSVSV
jgi:hypothetical protein